MQAEFRSQPPRLRLDVWPVCLILAGVALGVTWTNDPSWSALPPSAKEDSQAGKRGGQDEKQNWTSLFDGKSLKGWKTTKFGGEGDVFVKDGRIRLEIGSALTGIHTDRKLPRTNYEVTLEAMRVEGGDFFCGLTFPVKKDPCSLIIGGWGGAVCGLSSIDGFDASENGTTTYREFKNGHWYRIRLRVSDEKIEAWIDDKQIVEQELEGHKISIRAEVELSQPFGIATWQTSGALRNIRIRRLDGKKIEL